MPSTGPSCKELPTTLTDPCIVTGFLLERGKLLACSCSPLRRISSSHPPSQSSVQVLGADGNHKSVLSHPLISGGRRMLPKQPHPYRPPPFEWVSCARFLQTHRRKRMFITLHQCYGIIKRERKSRRRRVAYLHFAAGSAPLPVIQAPV